MVVQVGSELCTMQERAAEMQAEPAAAAATGDREDMEHANAPGSVVPAVEAAGSGDVVLRAAMAGVDLRAAGGGTEGQLIEKIADLTECVTSLSAANGELQATVSQSRKLLEEKDEQIALLAAQNEQLKSGKAPAFSVLPPASNACHRGSAARRAGGQADRRPGQADACQQSGGGRAAGELIREWMESNPQTRSGSKRRAFMPSQNHQHPTSSFPLALPRPPAVSRCQGSDPGRAPENSLCHTWLRRRIGPRRPARREGSKTQCGA